MRTSDSGDTKKGGSCCSVLCSEVQVNESNTVSSTSRDTRSFFVSVYRFNHLIAASSERGGGNSSGGSFMSTVCVRTCVTNLLIFLVAY
jgi:hypothetical protein